MEKNDPNILSKTAAYIRKSLERERTFLEALMDAAVLVDRDCNILLANKTFSRLSGQKRRSLAGSPVGRYFMESSRIEEILHNCVREQAEQEANFTILSAEGVATQVKVKITPLLYGREGQDGLLISCRDLSWVRQAEEQTAHLAAIVTSSSDAIISQSPEGIMRVWNESAERIFGYSAAEAVGQPAGLIVPAELVEEEQDVIDRIWRGEEVGRYETLRKRKDGRIINVAVAIAPLRDPLGNITGISKVERDITDQKKFEKELLEAKRNAEREKSLAEDAMRVKQQFLSSMSHEIRTPLNAIVGFSRLMLKSRADEKEKEYLNAIRISGDALMSLVNDILDLGKAESGKMVFEKTSFRLRTAVNSIIRLFESSIFQRKLQLITSFDEAIPDVVIGDSPRLQQILLNLIGNAVKFTQRGKITVAVELLKQTHTNVTVRFLVADTGIGIPESELHFIFDNFRQAGGATARIYGGTGLGLAIVKHLVTLQGGTVDVRSRPGEGSVFSFTLEFEHATSLPVSFAPDSEVSAEEEKDPGLRVLLVDDVMLNQIFMKTLLNSYGCDVHVAANGRLAIEKLKKNRYDLILMDLQMPEMNGYEATAYIRKELKLDVPVIALTADVTTADVERCRETGMNDYIPKPVDEKLLQAKIKKYGRPRSRSERHARETESSVSPKVTNLDYMKRHTYNDPERMKQLLTAYTEEIPRLMTKMKQSINNMDWEGLSDSAHALMPSFQLVGVNPEYEEMARKVKEHASRKEESVLINNLVSQLEDICIQVIKELETELASL
jgi:PAS domain S-box-containing protein